MTKTTLKKAECLRDDIHYAECYLRDIKHYEQKLFDYNIKLTLPRTLGTFATNDEMYFCDKQLNLTIEPYNADEWQNPKLNGCCILPLEKFSE